MDSHKLPGFAKAGQKASKTVLLNKGFDALSVHSHALEPYLRKLGLPTKLNNQKIELLADTYVCKEGEEINVEQAKLLKLMGYQLSEFKFNVLSMRENSGKIVKF